MVDLAHAFSNPETQRNIGKAWESAVARRIRKQTDETVGPLARTPRQDQRRLSNNEIDSLIEQYRAGATQRELAKAWGIARNTVTLHLKRNGIATRRIVRKMNDEQVAEAAHLYQSGQSLAELGDRYGVHHNTVWKELKQAGVRMRPASA